MNDLRLPFVLWLPGDAAPDLSSMLAPVPISVLVAVGHQPPGRTALSDLPKAKDDANA
jgi:hypothetical protein